MAQFDIAKIIAKLDALNNQIDVAATATGAFNDGMPSILSEIRVALTEVIAELEEARQPPPPEAAVEAEGERGASPRDNEPVEGQEAEVGEEPESDEGTP